MSYNIPLFELNYDERETQAVVDTLKSRWISMGEKCVELEHKFSQMLGVQYAVAVTNCTGALHLALHVLNIGLGDEVICPSLTFAATVNAIKYVGATPVFCDSKSIEDLNINVEMMESIITNKTKAIIVMHYAGFGCDMTSIMSIAKKYNLAVIEDACHGPMSEYEGKKLGTIGDVGCFSFFSNKNISTGEGGMIVTRHESIYNRLKLLRSHGMTTMSYQRAHGHATSYDIKEVGFNYRLDDIRASLGIVQLDKLPKDLEERERKRKLYVKELSSSELISLPFAKYKHFCTNYIMPIVVKNSNYERRERIRAELHNKGIQTSVHYPAVHLFSAYAALVTQLPVAEYISNNEISLPMYAALRDEQIVYICQCLKEAVEGIPN